MTCPYCAGFGMRKCQDCRAGLTCTRTPGHDGEHYTTPSLIDHDGQEDMNGPA